MLPAPFDVELTAILGRKATDTGCGILAVGAAGDHVHVLLRLAPSTTLGALVQRLKGATAHDVNAYRRLPWRLTWQDGYWAESFSPTDTDPLTKYVLIQRTHHDDSHPAERWQFDTQSDGSTERDVD